MQSIVEAVLENSRAFPDKIAIATFQREMTYGELGDKIQQFAAALKLRGIKKGSRIAVEAVDLTLFFAACLGCHLAGMIAVPLERDISIYKMQDVLKSTRPALVFYKDIGENYTEFFAESLPAGKPKYPKAETPSMIVSTTGTTGNPVLVSHTNRSMLATAQNLIEGIGITADTVLFTNVPFDLSAGFRRVFAALTVGATAIITYKPLTESLLLDFFTTYQVNSITLLYTDLRFLLGIHDEALLRAVRSVRYIETVAGAITAKDIYTFHLTFPNVILYNVYGTTESGCLLIHNTAEKAENNCLGKPACNANIRILDENGVQVTEPGKYGYIAVSGAMNMTGYYRKKALTETVMREDAILISDIVYFDADGYYYFVGRVGDIIDIAGHKVLPYEIERTAAQHPEILDCACAAEEDAECGQVPVLFIESTDALELDQLQTYLQSQLESYKVPKKIVRLEKIPRTANGKIFRRLLFTAAQK